MPTQDGVWDFNALKPPGKEARAHSLPCINIAQQIQVGDVMESVTVTERPGA